MSTSCMHREEDRLEILLLSFGSAVVATVGGMLFGFDISSMSGIIGTEQYNTYFNTPSGIVQGAIGASLAAGSVLGSATAGLVSDSIGRRNSIAFACLWWYAGTAVQTATNGVGSLIAGRILNGICVGITSSQVPVYIAEIARREKRGQLIIIQQLAIEWGILIMYFLSYGCSFIPGPASFRTAWAMQFVPCLLLTIGLPFLPESPRWVSPCLADYSVYISFGQHLTWATACEEGPHRRSH
jgi:MFS family permease